MTTKFNMIRDINGYNGFGLQFSDSNFNTILATGVAQTVTAPTDNEYYLAIFAFEPGARVWVAKNTTAAVPSSSVAATNSILNPVARLVSSGDTLSFITNDTTVEIGVSFYAI